MATLTVKNLENKEVGKVEVSDKVFAAEVKPHLIYEAVKHYLAKLRRGTASTKTRAEVAGGGKKPWRQKGTGRARHGSIRSPIWRGGGVVFGPKPRSYYYRLPKKVIKAALCSALSQKNKLNKIVVIDEFALPSPKTKEFVAAIERLSIDSKALVVDFRDNINLILSSRNVPYVKFLDSTQVNVYELLKHDTLLISKRAVLKLSEELSK
ncbi:MAG: 50S ribosomal protein L4 [Acidobacteria bacterium]|nr:50S ribosomal protein L4 [Acidobacteriota bacterium]